MHYKLVARDNIESNILEVWPPVLDPEFTLFNNQIIDRIFPTEEQIFFWLDSRSKSSNNKMTNTQKVKNGDPNKIYAVYYYDSDDPDFLPIYLYSIKMIRPNEAQSIIITENSERIKTSFKKFNIQKYDLLERIAPPDSYDDNGVLIDRHIDEGHIIHSSDLREVHFKYFEGVYPISQELNVDLRELTGEADSKSDEDDNDISITDKPYLRNVVRKNPKKVTPIKIVRKTDKEILYDDYMQYVLSIHRLDTEQRRGIVNPRGNNLGDNLNDNLNDNLGDNLDDNLNNHHEDTRSFNVAFSDPRDKWLDAFLDKLEKVQYFLKILANGGRGKFNLQYTGTGSVVGGQHEIRRKNLIEDIHRILNDNVSMTRENSEDFRRISNLSTDPLLYDGKVYQVRFGDTLLTWHANYSQVIRDLRLIPSKTFCLHIILFDFSDFFKQRQSYEILARLYENLMSMYQVASRDSKRVRYVKSKNPRIRMVSRKFQ